MTEFFTALTNENIWEPDGLHEHGGSFLPGLSTQRAFLSKEPTLVVTASKFEAYPSGIQFSLHVEGRGFSPGRFHFICSPSNVWPDDRYQHRFDTPEDTFRVGIEFSDGRRWQNLIEPDDNTINARIGGESGWHGPVHGASTTKFWIGELPPPGILSIHAAWPSVGLEECSAEFDADELLASASEAIPLFGSTH